MFSGLKKLKKQQRNGMYLFEPLNGWENTPTRSVDISEVSFKNAIYASFTALTLIGAIGLVIFFSRSSVPLTQSSGALTMLTFLVMGLGGFAAVAFVKYVDPNQVKHGVRKIVHSGHRHVRRHGERISKTASNVASNSPSRPTAAQTFGNLPPIPTPQSLGLSDMDIYNLNRQSSGGDNASENGGKGGSRAGRSKREKRDRKKPKGAKSKEKKAE
jgi:hypothetical protein